MAKKRAQLDAFFVSPSRVKAFIVLGIMKNGPWNFNSHLLILHRLKEGEDPLIVQFHWDDFWMPIHDLPISFISETVAQQLGNFNGAFTEYDALATQLGYKRIIRIRVRINVRKPLKRKKRVLPN
ncbi:hypothetical protein Gohar_002807, partial [Gossypium harknessii]|nr:hypothetical protein [Gossypium harknessii]